MNAQRYFALVNIQAVMALRADASRYFFGYIWWVLEPLLYVSLFYMVFKVILDTDIENYLVFLMCGKLTFVWFSQTVNKASESIITAKSLIGKINVSKTLFPMAVVQEGIYKQLAVFLLLFLVLVLFDYRPGLNWLWLIPILLVNYIVIVACALIGSCLVCLVRDFSRLIALSMVFLMFVSGVFWDVREISDSSKVDFILAINPIAFLIDAYRQVLLHGTAPDFNHLLGIAIVFGLFLYSTVKAMQRFNQYIALKVLTS